MPLPNMLGENVDGCLEQQWSIIFTYAEKIESCIVNAEWRMLALVLASRQAYLYQLFAISWPESCQAKLKELADFVLLQDSLFQVRVEEQKHKVSQLQVQIEHGRRAIKAYREG